MPAAVDDFSKRLSTALNSSSETAVAPPQTSDAAPETTPRPADEPAEAPVVADAQPVGAGDHVVRPGECVSSIAKESGHFWQTIWDDPANAEIKELRRQPNVLLPGDRLTVPPLRPKQEPGETEMRHRFVRRGEPARFRVRILDQDVVRANEPFTMVIDGNQTITGTTDPEGKIDVPIPGNARKAVLTVGEAPDLLKLNINLGGLEPVESWAGVQARLRNMGFACEVTGDRDELTIDALNEFRHSIGMQRSDDIDDATRQELLAKHGS